MAMKLKIKDYILLGVFSVLIFILSAAVSLALMPLMGTSALPLVAGVCLFFTAIVYLVMALKIGKRGALFLFAVISGLMFAMMGVPLMLPFFVLAGLVGEALLLPGDGSQYRRISRQSFAYAAYGVLYGVGDLVTIYVHGADYLDKMYDAEMRERALYFAYSPGWVVGGMLCSFLLALLGCWFAAKLFNKHFLKAGLIAGAGSRGESP